MLLLLYFVVYDIFTVISTVERGLVMKFEILGVVGQ